ncbi:tetratricopeptide repeat protein [Halomonas sp. MCCC 1A11036]|uniref:Tetratricopeptide repeat protein n=1 Tax=Billgrantia zhangzhouensis TaxID=2733481 RepID=A0ABS9AL21_9GAMM|nr:porin family protein [Halomonas zhangzhouensis]MCE8022411.1 tetratricopeptide repeat protein [Halomonas zhangzhouensis]
MPYRSPLKRRLPAIYLLPAVVIAASLGSPASLSYQNPLDEARQHLEADAPEAAYQQLSELDQQHAGTPEFDYWLGVTALRAGHPSQALLALDRVIRTDPQHAAARMARVGAYLRLGQIDAAERELDVLASLEPPAQARQAMQRYQRAIDERRQRDTSPRHQARLMLETGYDSNAQRFPSRFLIDPNQLIPEALRPLVEEADRIELARQSSHFQRFAGHYRGSQPLNEDQRLLFEAGVQSRYYQREEAQAYNLSVLQGRLGWDYDLDAERRLTLSLDALRAWQDTDFSRLLRRWGLSTEYRHPLAQDSQLRWHGHAYDNRFDQRSDSDYQSAGLGVELRVPRGAWTLRVSGLAEHERAGRHAGQARRDGGDLDHLRLGVGLDIPVGHRQQWRFDLDHRWRRYQDEGFALYNDFSPAARHDRSWEASVGWYLQLDRDWLLHAKADYERRHSSIEFFDNHRVQARLGLSYLL